MIKITGDIHGFIRELDLAFAKLDRDISDEFEKWTKKVHESLVESTPQFTGDLATAWNYSLNGPDYTYTAIPDKLQGVSWSPFAFHAFVAHQRGDQPAVSAALGKVAGVHPTWRDVVYLTNPAPVAARVERYSITIRPVNLIDGRVAMVQYHVDKFNAGGLNP